MKPPPFTRGLDVLFEELAPEDVARQLAAFAAAGNARARHWLDQFAGVPASRWPLAELVDAAADAHLIPPVSGERIDWEYLYNLKSETTTERLYALAMVRVIEAGLMSRFRRCAGCRQWFFATTKRARWCSTCQGPRPQSRRRLGARRDGARAGGL